MRQLIDFIKEKLNFLYLDIISIPAFFITRKASGRYHLRYICHKCPNNRRLLRDVENKGVCFWNHNWEKGNYDISKNFGIKNYVKQYLPRKKY